MTIITICTFINCTYVLQYWSTYTNLSFALSRSRPLTHLSTVARVFQRKRSCLPFDRVWRTWNGTATSQTPRLGPMCCCTTHWQPLWPCESPANTTTHTQSVMVRVQTTWQKHVRESPGKGMLSCLPFWPYTQPALPPAPVLMVTRSRQTDTADRQTDRQTSRQTR